MVGRVRMVCVVTGCICALLAGGTCGNALAAAGSSLEPGVHIDPRSPAAKEYALPLAQARQIGAGGGASENEGPLFGAGITPSGPSGPTGSRTLPRSGSDSHANGETGGVSGPERSAGAPRRASLASPGSGGDGSLLALIGGGVAIIVLGGFGGTVLRHSRRPPQMG